MAKFNQPDPRNAGTQCWVNGLVHEMPPASTC